MLVQVVSLGEAHDDVVRACLVDSRVAIAFDGNPFYLGDHSLSVSSLFSVPPQGVRNTTECLDCDISKEFWKLFPHERGDFVVFSVLIGSDL